jgi:hypothetical protein
MRESFGLKVRTKAITKPANAPPIVHAGNCTAPSTDSLTDVQPKIAEASNNNVNNKPALAVPLAVITSDDAYGETGPSEIGALNVG